MIKCPNCGREMREGESCGCQIRQEDMQDYFRIAVQRSFLTRLASAPRVIAQGVSGFSRNLTEILSSGGEEYEMHTADGKYEYNMQVVDECVVPTDQEIQVRQYEIARMRTPFLKKAYGRLQVTNKRVIFRAAGKSLVGPIVTEKEFAIDEIGGVDIKTDYRFSVLQFIISTFYAGLMASAIYGGELWLAKELEHPGFLLFLIAVALYIVTAMLIIGSPRKRTLKTALLGGCVGAGVYLAILAGQGEHDFLQGLCWVLTVATGLLALVMWILSGIVDDMQICIKVKGGHDAFEIARKLVKDERSGFQIVEPSRDTELAIREVGALVNDIKLLGNRGIEKWRV